MVKGHRFLMNHLREYVYVFYNTILSIFAIKLLSLFVPGVGY
jgi:hypothetical protein